MAGFGAKERLIAKLLSAFPGVKRVAKKAYIYMNALVFKKHYNEKVLIGVGGIETIWKGPEESFFGYYDKCPENNRGDVLVHVTDYSTKNVPSAKHSIKIGVVFADGRQEVIGETASYNWQQGARAMWLSDDLVMYNAYQGGKYIARVYSLLKREIVKSFEYPVQEAYGEDFFLSINYRRIMAVRPDYGYRNMEPLVEEDLKSYTGVGIVKVDYKTKEASVIIPMEAIVNVAKRQLFDNCVHVVNHLMLSPAGTKLVFVHRFYEGKRRHDRLLFWNGEVLKCLLDDEMVSHYCWIDEDHLFGYVRVNGTDGFYTIDVHTGETVACNALNSLGNGDGHPTYYDGTIVVDTYPDKSRMQHLMMLKIQTQKVDQIAEVYQSVGYMDETRCDMHPRFSLNGKSVYFDTVYLGKRTLSRIVLSK